MKGRAARQISAKHDAARLLYKIKAVISKTPVEDMHALKELIMDFMYHQYRNAIVENPDTKDLPSFLLWSEACDVLERKYAGGLRGVLHAARSGVNGGVRGIIETLYEHLKSEHEKAFRTCIFNEVLPPNDWIRKVKAAKQLLNGFQTVVPAAKQIPAEEAAPRLREFIEIHIKKTSILSGRKPGRQR